VAEKHIGIRKIQSNYQLRLIDEMWHYQNALSALGTIQRARRWGSQKAAQVFFAEVAPI
jgi:hypothetical protein